MVSEVSTIYLAHLAIKASAVSISPEFALAFAMSRPLRRLRAPIDVATAAALSKVAPSLSIINLTSLGASIPTPKFITQNSTAHKASQLFKRTVDDYGVAYLFAARVNGAATVCAVYALLSGGVDVVAMSNGFISSDVGHVAGHWAAAVVCSSALYPGTTLIAGAYLPKLFPFDA